MQLNQALVVYKQVTDHKEHLATLNELYEILKELGISFDAQSTRQLQNIGKVDLVITVGGDGTVLTTSHFIDDQPVLGIKSFGHQSVGYFCAASKATMKRYLQEMIAGEREPIKLHRLQAEIGGQKVAELALNDVLFANLNPASTSKYELTIGDRFEEQKSSGIWVSTAAGSTAAMKGAGGKVLKLTSDKIEYAVREPYTHNGGYRLKKGVLPAKAAIRITSLIPQGTVFIDGGATQYPAPEGAEIVIKNAKKQLNMYWK